MKAPWSSLPSSVALRKEGVDRNHLCAARTADAIGSPSARRAWIEIIDATGLKMTAESPSARRAWIEILADETQEYRKIVALRKEGVDRNLLCRTLCICHPVALRKEGVDRNTGC